MPTVIASDVLVVEPRSAGPAAVSPAAVVPPSARRGGRAGLTPAAVIAEAARLADETRDARVPLATVADRLGVRLPSLYKHVAGADGLRRGLARLAAEGLRAALEGAAVDAAEAPRAGRLAAVAAGYRGWAAQRPGLYLALAGRPHPDDAEHAAALAAVTAVLTDVVLGYGASGDDDVLDRVRLLRSGLHGFVALEGTGGLGVPDDVDRTFDRLVAALDAVLAGPLGTTADALARDADRRAATATPTATPDASAPLVPRDDAGPLAHVHGDRPDENPADEDPADEDAAVRPAAEDDAVRPDDA